jgi:hypothetical protein
MGRHQTAMARYTALVITIPLIMMLIAYSYTSPYLRPFSNLYLPPVNMYYFYTFLLAGLIALLFELPFSRPDVGSGAGKFATALVAAIGGISLLFAALIGTGYYNNITTDTGFLNSFLAVFMLFLIGMFAIEAGAGLWKQRRFSIHSIFKA